MTDREIKKKVWTIYKVTADGETILENYGAVAGNSAPLEITHPTEQSL